MRLGRSGTRDKLIVYTGTDCPISLRWYVSVRLPLTKIRYRRFKTI